MSGKIGFGSVFAIVTGSQIGSGVFTLPANLAPYGWFSLVAWLISGLGAIALALVFAQLCAKFPKTGGPHAYVKEAFGDQAAFFTGWTYWVISWVSTTAVIVASIGYLSPFIGEQPPGVYLALESLLLILITALNLKGVKAAGHAEFVFTIIKIIPLFIIPLIALPFFKSSNFILSETASHLTKSEILNQVTLLTLWCFIGLESATTTAESVENPTKTIPRAIIFGTICVAILYFINSIGIMGVIPGDVLAQSKAPYIDATKIILGGNWHLVISVIASVICIGTLNAWVLASGQISLGLAQDGFLSSHFKRKNASGAPVLGLCISCLGILPLLFLTSNNSLSQQISLIIDFSVVAFLFVYLICCAAFLKLAHQNRKLQSLWSWIYGGGAFLFCGWVIYETPLKTLAISSLFVCSGLPIYFFRNKKTPL